ncbi:hypothetical protein TNCV_2893151 [Trichonephila clavipes]|nr:hypothetical protein TNCV_2893151 [Trichonephila clavipes]
MATSLLLFLSQVAEMSRPGLYLSKLSSKLHNSTNILNPNRFGFTETTFYLPPATQINGKYPQDFREAGPLVLSSWISKRHLTVSG